jgi:hypothetical protein
MNVSSLKSEKSEVFTEKEGHLDHHAPFSRFLAPGTFILSIMLWPAVICQQKHGGIE